MKFTTNINGKEYEVKYLVEEIFDENFELIPELAELQDSNNIRPKAVVKIIELGTGVNIRKLDRIPSNLAEICETCVKAIKYCSGDDLDLGGSEETKEKDPLPKASKGRRGKKSTK